MSRRDGLPRDLGCPRCGYDQRGVVESWRASCPLHATCTECGLGFEWAELLNPDLRRPRWCVETVRRWWQVPWASVKTLLMVLRPWRFWRELKMTHGLRGGRLVAYGAIVAALLYALFAAACASWIGRSASAVGGSPSRIAFSTAYAAALPFSDFPPAAYYVPGAMARYGQNLPWTPLENIVALIDDGPHPNWLDVRYALLTGDLRSVYWRHPIDVLILVVFATIPLLTAPLGFLLLPATLRRARVRPRHIVRITVYSLSFAAAVAAWALGRFVLDFSDGWPSEFGLYHELIFVGRWIAPAWLIAWWGFAVSRYLKLPHAFGVALAVTVIGMLIGPAVALVAWSVAV